MNKQCVRADTVTTPEHCCVDAVVVPVIITCVCRANVALVGRVFERESA